MKSPLRSIALVFVTLLALAPAARAQLEGGAAPPEPSSLVHATAERIEIAAGGKAEAVVKLAIQPTWHINSNPPSPDYMIPTQVQIAAGYGVTAGSAVYPPPVQLKVEFDEQPLSVYTGEAAIRVPLTAAAGATNGRHTLKGTVRYQSCNDQVCTAPTKVTFTLDVVVTGGAEPGAAGGTGAVDSTLAAAAPPDTTATAETPANGGGIGAVPLQRPAGAAITSDPIANALSAGGFAAFAALFLVGLALNLTPCVYPMFGVTVSIFGARDKAASTLQVFGAALVYVLGIMSMYSVLGTVAAMTGGLFGSFLQNPLVLAGIGLLLILMSLSMFGLYELQPPSWLLQRLGGAGATNVAGLFFSGLVVGVFAAPCVGPPVVALLAIVAAKADPWFGFRTFFTLSLGLGAPYLLLATFSNLLQNMPRSGDWMIWVKKVFGVTLLSLGLFYALNSVAPKYAPWVAPLALLFGGFYLGFVEKSAAKRPGFLVLKRATGVLGLAGAVWMLATAPKQGIVFQPYDETAVQQALASGKPVILDFSADWCLPCHELDRNTFTNARVIDAARPFAAFRVDLTHSDSPEVEAHTRKYRIQGVPTVIFLRPAGEVQAARFSGFLSPEQFLEKIQLASREG